jgi:hypothetical protein
LRRLQTRDFNSYGVCDLKLFWRWR